MKTLSKVKFGGTILEKDIETYPKKLYYAWNEYPPCLIVKDGSLLGQYMRIKLNNYVYFVTDSELIEKFLNDTPLLNDTFFLHPDITADDFSDELIEKYFELIS